MDWVPVRLRGGPKERLISDRGAQSFLHLRPGLDSKVAWRGPNGEFQKTLFLRLFAFEAGAFVAREKGYWKFFYRGQGGAIENLLPMRPIYFLAPEE